jgi:hypothetical protein
MINFTLSFDGNNADDHEIDFYDVAQAMIGFQRSLAITTHLVINGEIITQAPSLKNARILALPPQEGSWEIVAAVVGGAFALGTAPRDTPIGHLIHSVYDYIVSETLGFRVNYDESLGQQYERLRGNDNNTIPILEHSQIDSAIEKCEHAIQEMHRPMVKSETATSARLISQVGREERVLERTLTLSTYEYVHFTQQTQDSFEISGRVSSYNINTYKGRIFLPEEQRPIPFVLADSAKDYRSVSRITQSLTMNAQDRFRQDGNVYFVAFKNLSRTGRLKSLYIVEVLEQPDDE